MDKIDDTLKLKIQELLGEDITQFSLKGEGWCNTAYYVETRSGGKYIVKKERENSDGTEQNSLLVEADVIKKLYDIGLSVPVPRVVFVSENPPMYGYEYLEGDLMMTVWPSLSETERIVICKAIGRFHAEIGKKFTKEMAQIAGIKIDESPDVHPEVADEYGKALSGADIPDEFKSLAREARAIFESTMDKTVFQFLHNDAHHENIIIKDKKVSGIIDFGDAEWGETAKEFSRYIRDYPDYFLHIVSAYEKESGNSLSYARLVSNGLLCGLAEILENYRKGGEGKIQAEQSIATYRKLLDAIG